jgi:hypothetical protein
LDSDEDGVCDAEGLCPGFDDVLDPDEDGVPNGCDPCESDEDPSAGADEDGVPVRVRSVGNASAPSASRTLYELEADEAESDEQVVPPTMQATIAKTDGVCRRSFTARIY